MPIKKIKAGAKKVVKVSKAVAGGIKDYSKQMKEIDKAAQKKVGKSGSREVDIKNQAKARRKIKKEEGASLKNSIKKRLK